MRCTHKTRMATSFVSSIAEAARVLCILYLCLRDVTHTTYPEQSCNPEMWHAEIWRIWNMGIELYNYAGEQEMHITSHNMALVDADEVETNHPQKCTHCQCERQQWSYRQRIDGVESSRFSHTIHIITVCIPTAMYDTQTKYNDLYLYLSVNLVNWIFSCTCGSSSSVAGKTLLWYMRWYASSVLNMLQRAQLFLLTLLRTRNTFSIHIFYIKSDMLAYAIFSR